MKTLIEFLMTDEEWMFTKEFAENVEIQYVHQLQNLYFALTGKELELKKEKV